MDESEDFDLAALAVEDEAAALRLLDAMRILRGISRRELDRRLGRTEGYMAQVLGGFVALKFRLLVQIVRALDFEPWLFFFTVFSRPPGALLDRKPTAMEHILEVLTATSGSPRRAVPRELATVDLAETLPRVKRLMAETARRAKPKPAGEPEAPPDAPRKGRRKASSDEPPPRRRPETT
jgi:hypothetical protein